MVYVVDDPKLLFQMQGDGSIAQTGLGNNVSAISTAGSTSIGRSKNALDASSIATTNSLPLRVVDFVDGPKSSAGDSFTDCIVTYLPLSHASKPSSAFKENYGNGYFTRTNVERITARFERLIWAEYERYDDEHTMIYETESSERSFEEE